MAKYHYTIDYKGKKSQSSSNGRKKLGRVLIGVTIGGAFGYIVYLNWGAIVNAFSGLTNYLENNLSSSASASYLPPTMSSGTASAYSGTSNNSSSSFFNFVKSQPWYPYVAQFGMQYNVPQSIILGVIEQESGGNSNNKSSLGAIGLMQIMPSTAQQVASVNNISYTGQNDLFNPVINIQIGTAYLSSLYSRFNDWTTALNAYFAGPNNAYNTYQTIPEPQTLNMPSGSTYGQQVLIRASYIKNNIASSTNLLSYLDNTGGGQIL